MKVIVAGSRTIDDYALFWRAMEKALEIIRFGNIDEVVRGCAKGVDKMAGMWATQVGLPVKYFKADWETDGRGAGYVRNYRMAQYADALIAIWDGSSPGTLHMINTARSQGLQVVEIRVAEGQLELF